jgi:hypothetical protein
MKRIHPAILFLAVAVLSYGLLLPRLGFYWDDLPMSWIRYQLGSEAMTRYFSSNRPVWGLLYQVTTRILPHIPIYWQVFALLLRALTGLLAWGIFKRIWRNHDTFALTAAFFFMLYPGFNQQWGSYLYSHFFIVLNFFLASYYFMLRAFDDEPRFTLFTALALLCSALNLWMMEYFFFAELVRIVVIWFALKDRMEEKRRPSLVVVLKRWIPYLLVWIADLVWRMFIFNNQVYSTTLLADLKVDFLPTLIGLFQIIVESFRTVHVDALLQIFQIPLPLSDGIRTTGMVAGVVVLVFGIAFYGLQKSRNQAGIRFAFYPILLSLAAFLTAGWPFWLIEFPPTLAHPTSRFTLPFMFGVSLLWAGLLECIPWQRWRTILAGLLIALMAGRQAYWMTDYKREWDSQKMLFWQMTWRAPGLEKNTTVLLNDRAFLSPSATGNLPPKDARVFNYYADNSLAAVLNWVYAPDNHSDRMDYLLLYPKSRLGGSLPSFKKGDPINYDYLAGTFEGSTSQVVAFYYSPPGCLRLLDADIDQQNRFMPDETLMREAASLSSSTWVLPEATAVIPAIYGDEPEHGWCYYFEQADLARQQQDWKEVVRIAGIGFGLDDHPNDPVERFVFIEGYAHVGDWAKATDLSIEAWRVSKDYMTPMLCSLWSRIAEQTPSSAEQIRAVASMREEFSCQP